MDFPGGSVVKNLPVNARASGSVSGLGRFPREGNDNPFQYSCLGNPTDRQACQAKSTELQKVGHNLVTECEQEI